MISQSKASDQRWAMDAMRMPRGDDGWARRATVIDCQDREVIGAELALRGRAKEGKRELEEVCLKRFGTVRPRTDLPVPPLPRRLQGLPPRAGVHHALHPRAERHHRTRLPPLNEKCVCLHNFTDFTNARKEVIAWIYRCNTRRPHSALGYKSPAEYRAQQLNLVA